MWVDRDDHFSSKRHLKAVRNGYGAVVRTATRRDPFSDDHGRNNFTGSPIAAFDFNSQGINLHVNQAVSFDRPPDIHLFHPSACQAGDVMDGAFIIDSYYYFKEKQSRKKVMYLVELLDILLYNTWAPVHGRLLGWCCAA